MSPVADAFLNIVTDTIGIDLAKGIQGRQSLAGRDSNLGARFENARDCLFRIQVAGGGSLNQAVENRIVERRPPGSQIRVAFLEAAAEVLVPDVGHLCLRWFVVRPDSAARRKPGHAKNNRRRQQNQSAAARPLFY